MDWEKVGKGKILHLGVEPTKELLLQILGFFKVPFYTHSRTKDINTAIFQRGDRYFLIAVNNGNEDKSATVTFTVPEGVSKGKRKKRGRTHHCRCQVTNLYTSKEEESTYRKNRVTFSADIPRKDGRVLEIKLLR